MKGDEVNVIKGNQLVERVITEDQDFVVDLVGHREPVEICNTGVVGIWCGLGVGQLQL